MDSLLRDCLELVACKLPQVTWPLEPDILLIFDLQHERKTNMEKCQQQYFNRCQEYEKIRESAAKMETEILNTSSGTNASKLEKKKKAEEDALMKVCYSPANIDEAEAEYLTFIITMVILKIIVSIKLTW